MTLLNKSLDLLQAQTSLLQATFSYVLTHPPRRGGFRRMWSDVVKGAQVKKEFPPSGTTSSISPPSFTPTTTSTSTSTSTSTTYTAPSTTSTTSTTYTAPSTTFTSISMPPPSPRKPLPRPISPTKKHIPSPASSPLLPTPIVSLPHPPLFLSRPPPPSPPRPVPFHAPPPGDFKAPPPPSATPDEVASILLRVIPTTVSTHDGAISFISPTSLPGNDMMAQSVMKWSQSEVYNLFCKLGRRDIAEVLKTLGYDGSSLLDIEWVLEEQGCVPGFSDSELQCISIVLSCLTGRRI